MTIVDPRDYHLFTPLLYQVASCVLSPSSVAAPIRKVFRGAPNVRYRQDEVVALDHAARSRHARERRGARVRRVRDRHREHHQLLRQRDGRAARARPQGPAPRRCSCATTCSRASSTRRSTDDAAERQTLLTFCIVGAGPTGVEYAGALAEFVRLVRADRSIPSSRRARCASSCSRVVTASSPAFKPRLSAYTARQLVRLGVEVRTDTLVTSADADGVVLHDGTELPTATMVWTAGVRPHDLVQPESTDRAAWAASRSTTTSWSRAPPAPTRSATSPRVPTTTARSSRWSAPPAMQAGRFVAAEILGERGRPFRYRDKGMLATIGRRAAVGQIGPITFTGLIGWLAWLVVHLYYLIGFENRVRVRAALGLVLRAPRPPGAHHRPRAGKPHARAIDDS